MYFSWPQSDFIRKIMDLFPAIYFIEDRNFLGIKSTGRKTAEFIELSWVGPKDYTTYSVSLKLFRSRKIWNGPERYLERIYSAKTSKCWEKLNRLRQCNAMERLCNVFASLVVDENENFATRPRKYLRGSHNFLGGLFLLTPLFSKLPSLLPFKFL